jgi:hypothetical protein
MRKTLGLTLLLSLAAGCGPVVTMQDDVDIVWDWKELVGPSNELHTPYVLGASMNLYVHTTDDNEKMEGWTVESSDTSIFTVDAPQRYSDKRIYVPGHAVGDGTAQLLVRNSGGHVVGRADVEVRRPDRAQLMAHGMLIIGRSESQSTVSELRLLNGGTATFLVHYFAGDRQLSGNGALSVDAPSDVTVTTPRSWVFEDRDWLQVTPSKSGTSSLTLKVAGEPFGDVPLTVVDGSEVDSLHIIGQDESHAKKDQWLVALGQAYDSSMRQIFGVEFNWDVDGQAQSNWDGSDTGDLYRYKFDPKQPKMLAATYGQVSAVAMIHASEGFVDSSNNIGCSAVPGAATATGGLFLLAICFIAMRMRSRTVADR